VFPSFSQTKTIEKGTYISTNKGQKIKLNLLDNNKYELVFYSGDYKIKGDSLIFIQSKKVENPFNLTYKNDNKSQKIKIKFIDPSFYSFYVGTQKGSEAVQYERLSDIKTKLDPEWTNIDVEFEIDRTDYLYLVFEEYEAKSTISKFALPKDVSEITIKYELNEVNDLNLAGFYDKKTNELQIAEHAGKNPLTFINSKDAQPDVASNVTPIENKSVLKWTYPGKEPLVSDDFGVAVDSAATVDYASKYDFKFKVENNLKSAIAATKTAKTKFLIVYADGKNPAAKADFDAVLKDLEEQVGYYMYDAYNAQYDVFNYYLATADDKKWLKTTKISDSPAIVILNGDGDVLATAKSNLLDKKSELSYYDEFAKKLQRANAFFAFAKVVKNKKTTDADVISAFYKASILDIPYEYETTTDTVTAQVNPADFNIVKVTLDKKEVTQIWKKLIESHQKDTKPSRELVETILREIKNVGFFKQFFNEERVFNDTDFLAIDYLLKHYDAIEKMNIEDENGNALALLKGSLSFEISSALQQNSYLTQEGVEGKANQNKIIAIYKKLIASGKGNFDCYKNYFDYLNSDSQNSVDDVAFLKEFKSYFDSNLSTEKGNAIERLDNMFATLDTDSDYSYNGWNSFKDYHSNLANNAAWATVLKPANNGFIKDAISWSEYSLIVTKNNPYYLDTLGQLYYKDGQKEKAIATQKLAVKFLTDEIDEQTAVEIRETLTKMEDGTY
jgi:hypothetical protein